MSMPSKRDRAAGHARSAAGSSCRSSTCRCRSRRSARRPRPGRTLKLTSRTACRLRAAEGADLVDLVTRRRAAAWLRPPSSRPRSDRARPRRTGGSSAHLLERERAAVPEPAAGRRVEQRRRRPRDPGQPLARRTARRSRAATRSAGRVYGWSGSCMITSRRRLLGQLARVHDRERVGDLVQDRDVVGDHDHALHEAAVAELHERLGDGLLARDVERGGDLVGDQQRRVRAASRGPSPCAASCRPRARSGSGRARRRVRPDEVQAPLQLRAACR